MGRRIARILIAVAGLIIGVSLIQSVFSGTLFSLAGISSEAMAWVKPSSFGVGGLLFGIIAYILAPRLIDAFVFVVKHLEKVFSEMQMSEIFIGAIGLILSLVIALLVANLLLNITPYIVGSILAAVVFLISGYLGWTIPTKRSKEIILPHWFRKGDKHAPANTSSCPKVLDSSAIIDGRFFEVCSTGIIEGLIVVPQFVLDELRHISDSTDSMKRIRGRRGLDFIAAMQEKGKHTVVVDDRNYDELQEVDSKLLRLAADLHGMIVTTDYNLNKVAAVQGVPVFNVNHLANTLRIMVMAGEEVTVTIIREGKEANQGVAYYDDGTMIVVDGARHLIGATLTVVVTSVLQTAAGRMVFAKVKD